MRGAMLLKRWFAGAAVAVKQQNHAKSYFEDSDRKFSKLWRQVNLYFNGEGTLTALKHLIAENPGINKKHITDMILRLRLQTRHQQANKMACWLVEESTFKIEPSDLALRIEIAGRVSLQDATRYFSELPQEAKTEEAFIAMLRTYGRGHVVDKAETLMSVMKVKGYLGTIEPYNIMLNMYRRKNLEEKIRKTYTELLESGVEPNTETYLIALRSKKKSMVGFEGIEEKARSHLSSMMKNLREHPVFMLECMIRTYAVLGDAGAIGKLWEFLKKRDARISSSSYMVMVESYGVIGDVLKAESVFIEMEDMYKYRNLELMVRHFRSLLNAFTENGAMDKAKEVYNRVVQMGRSVSPMIYHDMVCGYMKIKDYKNALRSFEKAKENLAKGDDRVLYSTLLLIMSMHSENGDVQTAEKFLYEFRSRQGVEMYNSLLHAYRNAGVPIFNFERRMRKAGIKPNQETGDLLALLAKPKPISKPSPKNFFDI